MDFLVTLANALFVSGYLVRDMLKLRLLSLGGAACLCAYFFTLSEPLMQVVYWNLFYALLNLVWIIVLLAARWRSRRTADGEPLCSPRAGL